uniref:Dehydrogenase/reductase SDR family member 7C-B-like n=1 Tax=Pundamilia nyererei TaxID=303518 RepID=A0A3B4G0M9_9CICH
NALQYLLMDMDSTWTTTVLLVPCVILLTAGFFYLYGVIMGLLSKKSVRNKVVVITDALSGLGKECAGVFHKGGARLILCGKNWEKLEELADDLTSSAVSPLQTFPPKLVLLDFGDTDSMPEAIAEILDCYGCLDIIIFNSSMKVKAPAQTVSLEVDKLLMDNNYFGPVTLAKGVLASMISRRSGHLLLVNSIQGRLAVPFRSTCEFLNSLFHETSDNFSLHNVRITKTGFTTSKSLWSLLYTKKPLGVSPDEAAAEIVKTLNNKRKEVVIAPSLPKMAIYARSFFPNVFFAVIGAGVKNAAIAAEM